jgi:hypothetical protein
MLTLGGGLKKRELLSARLGDVLSSMYLASCVLKHFENQGRRATDLPLVEWSVRTLMYQAQEALHAFLLNFPNRPVAWFLRFFIFPRGRTYKTPSDEIGRKVVDLITSPGEARERLSEFAYTTLEPGNPLGKLQEALELAKEHAPLRRPTACVTTMRRSPPCSSTGHEASSREAGGKKTGCEKESVTQEGQQKEDCENLTHGQERRANARSSELP